MLQHIKKLYTRTYVFLHEKNGIVDGYSIKYILQKEKNSKYLVIVFSGFNDSKARYNYLMRIRNIKANKLFILDEKGREGYPGVYYLGTGGNFSLKDSVIKLIETIQDELGENIKLITCGSSKGGVVRYLFWSAFKSNFDNCWCTPVLLG